MFKYGSKTEYINSPFYGAMLFSDEYEKENLKKIIEIQIEQTKEKIFLLEETIKNDNTVEIYFKKMMENSLSHNLVNLKWFEDLLLIIFISSMEMFKY